jgi:hypothetical protein
MSRLSSHGQIGGSAAAANGGFLLGSWPVMGCHKEYPRTWPEEASVPFRYI